MRDGKLTILRREIDGRDGPEATFCVVRTLMSHDVAAVGSCCTSEGKRWRLGAVTGDTMWAGAQDHS